MLKTLKNLNVKKVAVFRALQLGDLLTAVPAFKLLRETFPRAEITLIGLPWAEKFVERYHDFIDRFIEFPGFLGLPEQPFQPEAFSKFLSKVQHEKFDLALQMQGSGTITNPIMEMFEANTLAGFYGKNAHKPNEQYFLEYRAQEHETERYVRLMRRLGAVSKEIKTEFPVYEKEKTAARKLLQKHNLSEKAFVCIHPGSREEARRWKPENFVKTADFITSKGYKVVFTGSEEERSYVEQISRKTKAPVVNLSGETSLGEAAAILKRSVLLVTNDTGIVHVASAAGAKSVIIYTKEGSNIERWAPLDREKHTVIIPDKAKRVEHVLQEIDAKLRGKTQRANYSYEHARAI